MKNKEILEELISNIKLVNPYHLKMDSNGYGEFPDTYKLTDEGIKYILSIVKNEQTRNT
jgi:hypothetical protein